MPVRLPWTQKTLAENFRSAVLLYPVMSSLTYLSFLKPTQVPFAPGDGDRDKIALSFFGAAQQRFALEMFSDVSITERRR